MARWLRAARSEPGPADSSTSRPERLTPAGRRVGLAIIAAGYCALGIVYLLATPAFEASDELVHYPYVKYLADGRGLPPPVSDRALNPAQQEATQPPLYYALAALATAWLDTGSAGAPYTINPHARIGEPAATDNRNMVVPASGDEGLERRLVLAVRLIRLLSLAMGLGTVLLTYQLARLVAPTRPDLALGAALVNATVPGFLFIAASVNNDNLVTLLASLTLYLLLRIVRAGAVGGEDAGAQPRVGPLVLLGLALGGAALAKLGGLLLAPVVAVGLGYVAWRRHDWWGLVRWGAIVGGVAFACAGWWYLRNWALFGDPTLIAQHVAIVGGRPYPVSPLDVVFVEGEGLRWSFWGVFGGFNVAADPLVYRLYDVLTGVALAGLVWRAIRAWRGGRVLPTIPVTLLGLWVGVLFVGLVRWSLLTMASQGRFLYPAMGVLGLALFAGLRTWLGWMRPGLALIGVGVPLAGLALVLPLVTIAPAYYVPPLTPAGALDPELGSARLDLGFGGKLMLVASRLAPARLVGGDPVTLDLYWRVLSPMDRDYSIYIQLYDGAGRVVARRDTYPGGGGYATSRLPGGAELHDRYRLQVDPAARPGEGHLDVGIYAWPEQTRLQPYDGAGRPLVSPNVGSFAVHALDAAPAPPSQVVGRRFGDFAELWGYSLRSVDVAPGGEVAGALYWRALARPDRDYTIFVHLARPGASPVAQSDAQPRGGAYPTGVWRPGDEVYHPVTLQVPLGTPDGDYAVLVGLYDAATGDRMAVRGAGLGWLTTRLLRGLGRPGTEDTAVQLCVVNVR